MSSERASKIITPRDRSSRCNLMLKLATDENFDNDILRELLKQRPEMDTVRVQDVGLISAEDPAILEWAAQENRILLTHDKKTMTRYAYDRLRDKQLMPGVLIVSRELGIGDAVEGILMQVEATLAGEWEGQVRYVPVT
jgi:Domain of unknown function (DUF5615)